MRKHFRAENDISAGVGGGGAVLSREEPQWFQGEKRKLVGTKGPERGDEIVSWHRICRRKLYFQRGGGGSSSDWKSPTLEAAAPWRLTRIRRCCKGDESFRSEDKRARGDIQRRRKGKEEAEQQAQASSRDSLEREG